MRASASARPSAVADPEPASPAAEAFFEAVGKLVVTAAASLESASASPRSPVRQSVSPSLYSRRY